MERAELRRLALDVPGAVARGGFVFLCDPAWGRQEREAAARQMSLVQGLDASTGWLCIPTGGTSGQVRFARHDERTVGAAILGFQSHFQLGAINAVGVLPLHHVSGFLSRARCAATGGVYHDHAWDALVGGDWPPCSAMEGGFLSLVPTQLQRLLARPGNLDALRRFQAVFLGGAPTWPELASAAAEARIPVSLTYGMTETAAMVAAQFPADFLKGDRTVGRVLPHAVVDLLPLEDGDPGVGVIRIQSDSVFRGYFPDEVPGRIFATEDLGAFDPGGGLRVLGRRDGAIITGGEKVWPVEVEQALRRTGAFQDVAVIGLPDPAWGQAVVACHPEVLAPGELSRVQQELGQALARYKQPKRYVRVSPWPRNAQGKLNRQALVSAAQAG